MSITAVQLYAAHAVTASAASAAKQAEEAARNRATGAKQQKPQFEFEEETTLMSVSEKAAALCGAASRSDEAEVHRLVNGLQSCDANSANERGYTPLHLGE